MVRMLQDATGRTWVEDTMLLSDDVNGVKVINTYSMVPLSTESVHSPLMKSPVLTDTLPL